MTDPTTANPPDVLEEDHASVDLTDAERDLIVKGLTRFGRTVTVHDPDDVKAAHALLLKLGFTAEGEPLLAEGGAA